MTTRLLRTETRPLPVKLTDGEILERSHRAAELLGEADRAQGVLDEYRKEQKQRIAELESEGRELLRSVERGEELRDIEIEVQADYELRAILFVRTDSSEVYFSRPLTPDEAQMSMLPVSEDLVGA